LNESLGNPNVDVGLGNDSPHREKKDEEKGKTGNILHVFAED
jgi:hypothetical protein